jgi:hypothetical protein
MLYRLSTALAGVILCAVGWTVHAATPDHPLTPSAQELPAEEHWRVDGGEIRLRFNEDFLDLFGISVQLPKTAFDAGDPQYSLFPLRVSEGLTFNAPEGGFDRFVGGSLKIAGGFRLRLPDGGTLDLREVELRVNPDNPMHIDLVGADGQIWVYSNHLMYKIMDDHRIFHVRSADLRATAALSRRVGAPELAGAYIGEMRMSAHVVAHSKGFEPAPMCENPNFHGNSAPGGGRYQADVLMETYGMSFSRCRREDLSNGCDGAGPDDGQVVFTPSATLRNSNQNDTADVPWYRKFTVSPYDYPYPGNDQHPYLIWNMYRVADGQLEQIGGSGIKHAFLTINTGCAPGACTAGGHILGRNCGDTYGTGNNDSNSDLGPRHELIPSTGVWGRCGSVFDPNCTGSNTNPSPNTNYGSRLVVRESQMLVPGAQFYSEAWYIVQDDIDIYNTMAYRTMNPAPGGSGWTVGSQSAMVLGPVINAWVNPTTNPTRNAGHADSHGHVRVAVRVKDIGTCPAASGLSGSCYRYDYAVANFDWMRATTEGTLPNLRVTANKGFDRFRVPLPGSHDAWLDPDNHFADTDIDPGNDWSGSIAADMATWNAPPDGHLPWGTLYRFSLVTTAPPIEDFTGQVQLRPAQVGLIGGGDESIGLTLMVPSGAAAPAIFKNGFEAPGVP